jgi:2-amino-4-hydroxy-6-hydroxymethyldihydropteridine diphosphokinase
MNDIVAYIGLGSNLGDSRTILESALRRLADLSRGPVRHSSFWRSSPVDCPPGSPDFLNAVAALVPLEAEDPESMLAKLHQIEREFGRQPKRILNESRPLDLDLLAFGEVKRDTTALVLPHPRAFGRRFVLAPWAEVAPDLVLPGQKNTIAELLRMAPPAECEPLS